MLVSDWVYPSPLVASLLGVVLIARPEVIFGRHVNDHDSTNDGMDPAEKGTSVERLAAVGYGLVFLLFI